MRKKLTKQQEEKKLAHGLKMDWKPILIKVDGGADSRLGIR